MIRAVRLPILDRYFLRETLLALGAVLLVLVLVLLGGIFVRLLGKVADGSLEAGLLFPLVFWGAMQSLSTLLSVSLFLAILISLGRFYKDSEIYAMRASGLGQWGLLRPFLLLGGVVAVLLAVLALWLNPWATQRAHELRDLAVKKLDLAGVTPGRFIAQPSAHRVVFAEALSDDRRYLERLYIFQERQGTLQVMTARRARQVRPEGGTDAYLELEDGELFQGAPGAERHLRMRYRRQGIRLPGLRLGTRIDVDMLPPGVLLRQADRPHRAELHWRLSFPLSALVLTLLAVPLSHASPRTGRFGRLTVAILIYIFYANLLGMGRAWLEDGTLPLWAGLWWVHGAVVAGALALLAWQNGWRPRRPHPEAAA